MSVDLIAAALILAFVVVVVLGHVLVIAAIYRILRENHAAGDRRAITDPTTGNEEAKRAAGAANLGDTIEPQEANAVEARWLSRSAGPRHSRDRTLQPAAEQTRLDRVLLPETGGAGCRFTPPAT
jgi:hypothetical protein